MRANDPATKRIARQLRRRGAACVEAALVLPVLILLIFGFIEVGHYVNSHHVLQDAARQGARAAASQANSNAAVRDAVVRSLSHSIGATSNAITVKLDKLNDYGAKDYEIQALDQNEQGQAIRVTVTIAYSQFQPPSSFFGLAGSSLTSSAVMQRQK